MAGYEKQEKIAGAERLGPREVKTLLICKDKEFDFWIREATCKTETRFYQSKPILPPKFAIPAKITGRSFGFACDVEGSSNAE